MSRVETVLEKAAQSFVNEVLGVLRTIELEDLVELRGTRRGPGRPRLSAGTGTRGGKRVRRSIEAIRGEAKKISTLVARAKDGLRAEEILERSGLVRKELPRVIAEALSMKLIRKTGHKRATTYFAK